MPRNVTIRMSAAQARILSDVLDEILSSSSMMRALFKNNQEIETAKRGAEAIESKVKRDKP